MRGKWADLVWMAGAVFVFWLLERQFIRDNKKEIDRAIRRTGFPREATLNNKDREEWILNDEGLYRWAQVEGVRI